MSLGIAVISRVRPVGKWLPSATGPQLGVSQHPDERGLDSCTQLTSTEVCDCVNCNEPINFIQRHVCLPEGSAGQMNTGQILIQRVPPIPERRGGERCQKDKEINETWVKIPVMCSSLSGFLSPFDQGWEQERRGRQLGADPGSAGRKET